MIVASWGWGLNSTWMIVKAIEQGRPPDVILSLDTGTEYEDTYCTERWYVENVWKPNGLEYIRLHPETHPQYYDKRIAGRSLYQFCIDQKIVPLPAARWCSADWKGRPGDAWLTDHGCTENWLGFTAEETRRVIRRGCQMPQESVQAVNLSLPGIEPPEPEEVKRDKKPWIVRAPLWEDGDSRRDCVLGLTRLGLLIPEKSGCGICPFNAKALLAAARGGHPLAVEWMEKVITLEETATENVGRPVGITPDGDRLKDFWEQQLPLDLLDDLPVIFRPCECSM